ncbi:Cysteine synthase 2 [Penicillium atrosanguineum]|nr:Cysteine synthase 2 [Penicillium atrosanguineum]KAJ5310720.1 Cysteine synthase 2 [Penicillium atrosanguineum]
MDPFSPILSPQSPVTPSNVFRPRRSDDWHEYRDIIEQLYRTDQLKLRDVKRIMERDYKFFASEKQYKDRLAAWHVRKNIKAEEVHIMIRKQKKRAARGKQTAFRRSGQEVDQKRIARFVRRYGSSWSSKRDKDAELQSPEPPTPSDMTCYTPEPAEEASVVTPGSPPDVQSPTRETPNSNYQMNFDPTQIHTLPDLVIDDDSPYSIDLHSNPSHHPHPQHSRHSQHSQHPHQQHHQHQHHQHHAHSTPNPNPNPNPQRRPYPHIPDSVTGSHSVTGLPPVSHAVHPIVSPGPVHAQPHHVHSHHSHANHDHDVDAPGEVVTHSDDWNRLDTFQTRLEGLQYTLDRTMSKWAREADPNQEIPHHEGLGM